MPEDCRADADARQAVADARQAVADRPPDAFGAGELTSDEAASAELLCPGTATRGIGKCLQLSRGVRHGRCGSRRSDGPDRATMPV
ncbi:hypothetical protein Kpho01_63860 [Kitasatospora phosalacinea]|uniref:Uncharacterized protein n=1 Tax=Kitasatospora phosalacinea TaxID=2065 RepID=A0A9W6PNP0_9ACTN|nr:hypothetical protein Kpho01_63860 [Kitasatospora phosalacinea]